MRSFQVYGDPGFVGGGGGITLQCCDLAAPVAGISKQVVNRKTAHTFACRDKKVQRSVSYDYCTYCTEAGATVSFHSDRNRMGAPLKKQRKPVSPLFSAHSQANNNLTS